MNEENVSAEITPERTIVPQGTVAVTIGADSQSDGFYFLLACGAATWSAGYRLPAASLAICGAMKSGTHFPGFLGPSGWIAKATSIARSALRSTFKAISILKALST